MKFHVLNSSGKLDSCAARLVSLGESVVPEIQARLPVTNVDVVLYYNPDFIIPETGMCGNAQTAHTVWIALDPDNSHFNRNLDEEFTATLVHELYHCMRQRGPGTGYGRSLAAALINEGLAVAFELQFRRGTSSIPYLEPLSESEGNKLYARAESEFSNTSYDHAKWFFAGSSEKGIPPFGGYRLGHFLVSRYINLTGSQVGDLWNEATSSFL